MIVKQRKRVWLPAFQEPDFGVVDILVGDFVEDVTLDGFEVVGTVLGDGEIVGAVVDDTMLDGFEVARPALGVSVVGSVVGSEVEVSL